MEGSSALQVMNHHPTRLERFDGDNFTHWQETMKFFLVTVKLFYILEDDLEEIPEETDKDDAALKAKRAKRKEDDFLCRGHILNSLSTPVYNAHRTLEQRRHSGLHWRISTAYPRQVIKSFLFLILWISKWSPISP